MPTRIWWWQRLHPVVRAVLAAAYFGGAGVAFVLALTPGSGAAPTPSAEAPAPRAELLEADPGDRPVPPEEGAEPVAAPTGRELFVAECADCHGFVLEGDTGPALGRGSEAVEDSDARLLRRIREGEDEMPSFSAVLTEDEMELIVAFIREEQAG
ncbi:MAG: c-type cytochrome [Acidimicrobiales bacterium]